jgi:UDP-4-amino-4,6-dideoxy-N-acetyl-beta-L-altrosamine N-acetyltransferase
MTAIEKASLSVRPLLESDATDVLAWRNHPDVRRFMFWSDLIPEDAHMQWMRRALIEDSLFVRIVEQSGQPIGLVNFRSGPDSNVAEWGFYLVPDAPTGSGTQMGEAALEHAFYHLQFRKICGQALGSNTRSQRFHLRMGFSQEGRLREQFCRDGHPEDVILYGLLKSEFRGTA